MLLSDHYTSIRLSGCRFFRFCISSLTSLIALIFIFFLSSYQSYSVFASAYYVEPMYGDDSGTGDISDPWKTLKYSIPKLSAGDTLYLRAGTYREKSLYISVYGTPDNKITIRNYPGERPVIDGGYTTFRQTPNSDWKLYDAAKNIYQSIDTYPFANYVFGYFGSDDGNYRLITYSRYSDLSSSNENYTATGSIYCGPGVFWNPSDRRIYIRLNPSQKETDMGYYIPSNKDPRYTSMCIFPYNYLFIFMQGTSYIDLEGIDIQCFASALEFSSGSHHISAKDVNITSGRNNITICDGAYNITLDDITIMNSIPPWVGWSDVKYGTQPAGMLKGVGISIKETAHDVEIKNCTLLGGWSATHTLGSSCNTSIHHNTFKGIRDDCIPIGSGCYNIEVYSNKISESFGGISWYGSGSSPKMGTKYIHHNIIDTSTPTLGGRNDPNNQLSDEWNGPNGDGMITHRPFGFHDEGEGFGTGDPWKVYNNTLIFKEDLYKFGSGIHYRISTFNPDIPHEVYNNIFIQKDDSNVVYNARVYDGSQIFDGNIYYRSYQNATQPFLRRWDDRTNTRHFYSLSEFKSSIFFNDTQCYYPQGWESAGSETNPQLDSNYRPSSASPAATGAINLSAKGWPGIDSRSYRGALAP